MSPSVMEIADTVKEFSPAHAAQIQYLLEWGSRYELTTENVRRGFPGARYADRISVHVPFCSDHIKWDIILNSQFPWNAPDIILPAEDEKFQEYLLTDDRESELNPESFWGLLKDWNVKDPRQLVKLITELRTLYSQYQRKVVEQLDDERLRFEIGTLSSTQGLQMCLVNMPDKSQKVKFAIPVLRVDIDLLSGRHEAIIQLRVTFPVRKGDSSWSPTVPDLQLFAPPILKELFDVDDVELPGWSDGMCITEYVPTLRENLKRQVSEAFNAFKLRKQFIEELNKPFGRPLEADTAYGRKVSILSSAGIFIFLVHFTLSIQFPKNQPTIVLQSCLHSDNSGKPISRSYNDYPWSPRWETDEMVQRIYDFIVDEVTNFRKYCNDIFLHIR